MTEPDKSTVTFRVDVEKKNAIDSIAASLERDRSYVINEAIRNYIELYEWQLSHIKDGARQADAGDFASVKQVEAAFAKFRK